jgi:hypothetical protein
MRSDDTGREPDRAGGDTTGAVAVADDPAVADFEAERLDAFFLVAGFLVAGAVVWAMCCSFELAGRAWFPQRWAGGGPAFEHEPSTQVAVDPNPVRARLTLPAPG